MFNSYPGTVLRGNGLMSSTCPGTCPDVQMFRKSPSVSTEAGWAAGAELRSKNTPQVEKKSDNCVRTEGSSRTEMETHNRQHQQQVSGYTYQTGSDGCGTGASRLSGFSQDEGEEFQQQHFLLFTTAVVKPKTADRFSGEFCHFDSVPERPVKKAARRQKGPSLVMMKRTLSTRELVTPSSGVHIVPGCCSSESSVGVRARSPGQRERREQSGLVLMGAGLSRHTPERKRPHLRPPGKCP